MNKMPKRRGFLVLAGEGQSQHGDTIWDTRMCTYKFAMSALPPKADIAQHGGNVRFVPKADSALRQNNVLFDHLVGAGEQRGRDGQAERLRGLEVDDKLEFGRLLNGQIGWLGTLEDFIDVASGAAKQIRDTCPV
jgi:hypothetical protein